MNDTTASPIFVALLFILRCVIPLAVLFGVSYLLRKIGLVAPEAPEPPDDREENGGAAQNEIAATRSEVQGGKSTVEKNKES